MWRSVRRSRRGSACRYSTSFCSHERGAYIRRSSRRRARVFEQLDLEVLESSFVDIQFSSFHLW